MIFMDYTNLRYEEEVFGKGAKKHIPEIQDLAEHTVSWKLKLFMILRGEACKAFKRKTTKSLYQI